MWECTITSVFRSKLKKNAWMKEKLWKQQDNKKINANLNRIWFILATFGDFVVNLNIYCRYFRTLLYNGNPIEYVSGAHALFGGQFVSAPREVNIVHVFYLYCSQTVLTFGRERTVRSLGAPLWAGVISSANATSSKLSESCERKWWQKIIFVMREVRKRRSASASEAEKARSKRRMFTTSKATSSCRGSSSSQRSVPTAKISSGKSHFSRIEF